MSIWLRFWILAGIALALTQQIQYEILWLGAFVPLGIWVLLGIVLLGAFVWRATLPATRAIALKNVCVIIIVGILFFPLAKIGNSLTERIRFSWYRASYDHIVSHIDEWPLTDEAHHEADVDFILDPGPPRRIAFIWPGGIIDNWCGIIFDPTSNVLNINKLVLWSYEWRTSYLTKLFDGDMTSCRTVAIPYYMCCFT
jgi:hypothetical protein